LARCSNGYGLFAIGSPDSWRRPLLLAAPDIGTNQFDFEQALKQSFICMGACTTDDPTGIDCPLSRRDQRAAATPALAPSVPDP
jgi:hypothetical protein